MLNQVNSDHIRQKFNFFDHFKLRKVVKFCSVIVAGSFLHNRSRLLFEPEFPRNSLTLSPIIPSRIKNHWKCYPERQRSWAGQSPQIQPQTNDKHSDSSATELGKSALEKKKNWELLLEFSNLARNKQIGSSSGRRESKTCLQRREAARRHTMEEDWRASQANIEGFSSTRCHAAEVDASSSE